MTSKIFVTGATGLVGLHVVAHLSQKGMVVIAGVRPSSNVESLKSAIGPALTLGMAELLDTEALSKAMAGCDVVVHCAGAVDPHARKEDINSTNVGGTKSALQAAVKAGAKQFIHISSLSVITGQKDQYDVDETAELRYCGEAYADSKVDAEKAVLKASGIETTILRPGFIYGPGERAWMPRLIGNLSAGKVVLIDGGTRQTNVIYVGNLALAVELSILNPKAFGQTFNLTDGNTPTKKELFDCISAGLSLPPVTKKVPRAVVKTVCDIVSVVAPMLPAGKRQGLSRFSRAAFRLAAVNQGFSIAKAERELGYVNRVAFNTAMTETLKHFSTSPSQVSPTQPVGSSK